MLRARVIEIGICVMKNIQGLTSPATTVLTFLSFDALHLHFTSEKVPTIYQESIQNDSIGLDTCRAEPRQDPARFLASFW